MRRSMLAVVSALVFFAVACTPAEAPPATPAVDLAAEEQAIRDISARWLELARAKDPAGIAALFADDGMLGREQMSPAHGRQAIEAQLAQDQAANPTVVPSWSTDRVEVAASGDLAVEHGTWSETGVGADGSGTAEGQYVTVYRKVDGAWKIVSDISVTTSGGPAGAGM